MHRFLAAGLIYHHMAKAAEYAEWREAGIDRRGRLMARRRVHCWTVVLPGVTALKLTSFYDATPEYRLSDPIEDWLTANVPEDTWVYEVVYAATVTAAVHFEDKAKAALFKLFFY